MRQDEGGALETLRGSLDSDANSLEEFEAVPLETPRSPGVRKPPRSPHTPAAHRSLLWKKLRGAGHRLAPIPRN